MGEIKLNMNLKQMNTQKHFLSLSLTIACMIPAIGCASDESGIRNSAGSVHAAVTTKVAPIHARANQNGDFLPPSIPGDLGQDTGGNIVMEPVYHQLSIAGREERVRLQFRPSPNDTYIASGINLPDGLSIQMESNKKRLYISGVPTSTALAESPYETEITVSNSSDSRTVKFRWHIRDGAQPDPDSTIRLCGGNPSEGGTLWSWAWAGKDQEYITSVSSGSTNITRLEDLSGNDHYYYTSEGNGHASETGYTWRTYYTPYPTVGLDLSKRSGINFGPQTLLQNGNLNASGPFYLSAVVMNTKLGGRGNREIFGSVWSNNGLKYTQDIENSSSSTVGVLALMIDGDYQELTKKRSYTSGPLLIEVYRDNSDVVHAMVNGEELTIDGGVSMPGVFKLSGLSSSSVSGFDDAGFEYVVCKGLPSEAERAEAREYLRSKWNLYSATGNEEVGVCK